MLVGWGKYAIARRWALDPGWARERSEQGLAGLYGEQRRAARDMMTRPWRGWRRCCRAASVGTHWTYAARRRPRDFEEYGAALLRLFGVHPHRSKTSSSRPTAVRREGRDIVGLYSTRQIMRSSCASMRKARSRRSSAPTGSADGVGYVDGTPTTTSGTVRHLFAALDVATGRCWPSARRATAIRSSWRSSNASTQPCQLGRRPPHRRQLRHPQAPEGTRLARRAGALPCPLHADLRVVAEPGRALVRDPDQPRNPPWLLRQRQGSGRRITAFVAAYNTHSQPLHLDRHRRRHPR